jgi:hypothetical protein
MDLFYYTLDPSLAAAHVSLSDYYALLSVDLAPEIGPIPRNCDQALSPEFTADWKPAMDQEIAGFLKHQCFLPVLNNPDIRTLPGQWMFTRKHTDQAQARFVIGGHRQRLGRIQKLLCYFGESRQSYSSCSGGCTRLLSLSDSYPTSFPSGSSR